MDFANILMGISGYYLTTCNVSFVVLNPYGILQALNQLHLIIRVLANLLFPVCFLKIYVGKASLMCLHQIRISEAYHLLDIQFANSE